MTPQEERNKRFDEMFADYGGEYSDMLDVPRSLVKEFIESEIDLAISDYQTNFEQKHIASTVRNLVKEFVHFIDRQINCLEKEIDYMQKHSKGNYADGKVEAFTKTIDQLTLLKELYK